METTFWKKKWTDDSIAFHEIRTNPRLVEFWPSLGLAADVPVFVPLCGKSLDMLWLHAQGHPVLGIEVSDKAVQAFFAENGLEAERSHEGTGAAARELWRGVGRAEGIELLVGDYFALTAERLKSAGIAAVYDRASLIAMNDTLRPRYARHLGQLMPLDSTGLVIAIDYDTSKMNGPPYPVPDRLVHTLLDDDFDIVLLGHYSGPEAVGKLAERGLDSLDERVYRVRRRAS